jgi:hypothetical protein
MAWTVSQVLHNALLLRVTLWLTAGERSNTVLGGTIHISTFRRGTEYSAVSWSTVLPPRITMWILDMFS